MPQIAIKPRKSYHPPQITSYGEVHALTRGGGSKNADHVSAGSKKSL